MIHWIISFAFGEARLTQEADAPSGSYLAAA
jgi:hypothetical protein